VNLIDRHILARFFANFVVLFLLLFIFAAAIDVILNLDRFVDASRDELAADAGPIRTTVKSVQLMLNFEAPRVFQFYAYLHGLVAVGAMGFTLAQMHRHRELVAVMASGVSLHRVAMPFIVAVFILSLVQIVNQEAVLPQVAPLLLRDHRQIGKSGVNEFEVRFTSDSKGTLLQSPSFDPKTSTLSWPTFLERDEAGRAVRRIGADSASWDNSRNGWTLANAQVMTLRKQGEVSPDAIRGQLLDFYATDISPQVLIVRRFAQFTAMLSIEQIREMLRTPGVTDSAALRRHLYSRFSSVLVNLLVMLIALPSFLLREPANLLFQSVMCAGMTIPAMIGAAIGMMVQLPGVTPAVSVFMPVLVLIPVALARITFVKT
jgi:lipopolysaccharide export system permease protein